MNTSSRLYKKLVWSGIILVLINLVGTFGYWTITGAKYSLLDTFYMTFITIATIGYGEIVDLSNNPAGRIFTVFISIAGIGVLAYVATNLTAFVVEGSLTESFRRRRMEKMARNSKEHYVVCGLGSVGRHIVAELRSTKRKYVMIDCDKCNAIGNLSLAEDEIFLEGDATDSSTLTEAGVESAKGLFAVTGDDNENLAICLTARQLSPNLRIVARCNELKNSGKLARAGADAIVCPASIGGMRMASEMIRPTAVSFLDMMLRDRELNLRVEEVSVPAPFAGKKIAALNLKKYRHVLLLAVKNTDDWVYNPPDDYVIGLGNALIVMTTPEGRDDLEHIFHTNHTN